MRAAAAAAPVTAAAGVVGAGLGLVVEQVAAGLRLHAVWRLPGGMVSHYWLT